MSIVSISNLRDELAIERDEKNENWPKSMRRHEKYVGSFPRFPVRQYW